MTPAGEKNPLAKAPDFIDHGSIAQGPNVKEAAELLPIDIAKIHKEGVELILVSQAQQAQALEDAWKILQEKVGKASEEKNSAILDITLQFIKAKHLIQDETFDRLQKLDLHILETCHKMAALSFDAQKQASQLKLIRMKVALEEEHLRCEVQQKQKEMEHREEERCAAAQEELRAKAALNKIAEENARSQGKGKSGE
jgi:hypothetical protein